MLLTIIAGMFIAAIFWNVVISILDQTGGR